MTYVILSNIILLVSKGISMKRLIFILLIFFIIFTGAPFRAIRKTTAEENINLVLWHVESEEPRMTITKEDIKIFNSLHSEIKIKYKYIDYEEYEVKLKIALAGNKMPDLINCWPGEAFRTMVEAGVIIDLNGKLDSQFKNNFLPGAFKEVTYEGKIYGIPSSFNSVVIWYNKQLFAKYNLEIPKTWDDLILIVESFNKKDVAPIAIAGKDNRSLLYWFSYLSQRIGGKEIFEKVARGDEDFTNPVFIEAAGKLKELINKNNFIDEFIYLSSKEAEKLFETEKAAMYLQGDWVLPFLSHDNELSKKMGFFAFPEVKNGRGNPDIILGGVNGVLAISSDTSFDNAYEFIKYYFNSEKIKKYFKKTMQPVPIKIKMTKENMPQLLYDYISYKPEGYFGYYNHNLNYKISEKLIAAINNIIMKEEVNIKKEFSNIK